MISRGGSTLIRFALTLVATLIVSSNAYSDDLLDWLHQEVMERKPAAEASLSPSENATLLTLESGEAEMYPKISPDGKHLLVVSGKRNHNRVTRRLLENGDPLNVVTDDQRAFRSAGWHGSEHATFLSDRGGDLGVWQMAANGQGAVRRLTRLTGEFVEMIVLDNGELIGVRLLPTSGLVRSGNIKMINQLDFKNWKIAGNETRLLHIGKNGEESSLTAGVNPSLSPDGKSIVFSMQTGHSWHLFMVDVDGSNLIQLTNSNSINVQPTWSPNGKWIAFTSNRGEAGAKIKKENWDVWMIRRDGQHLTRLTFDAAHDGAPAIGANGRVYYHSDRKVDRVEKKGIYAAGGTSGFHIWSLPLPAMVE